MTAEPVPTPTEDLRAQAWASLTRLGGELATLESTLEPTRRASDLRVINDEEKADLDAMLRKEKSERIEALTKHGGVEATGHIAAPARMRSVDAMAQVHAQLVGLERKVYTPWLCLLAGQHPTTRGRALRLRGFVNHLDSAELLAEIDHDAADLTDLVKRAIDGEMTTKLDADCPFCGRRSLVVYHEQGFIRCDRPRNADCLCGTDGCVCTRGRRHEWHRNRGQWDTLARMLQRRDA